MADAFHRDVLDGLDQQRIGAFVIRRDEPRRLHVRPTTRGRNTMVVRFSTTVQP